MNKMPLLSPERLSTPEPPLEIVLIWCPPAARPCPARIQRCLGQNFGHVFWVMRQATPDGQSARHPPHPIVRGCVLGAAHAI
jgi:hypothetical protein